MGIDHADAEWQRSVSHKIVYKIAYFEKSYLKSPLRDSQLLEIRENRGSAGENLSGRRSKQIPGRTAYENRYNRLRVVLPDYCGIWYEIGWLLQQALSKCARGQAAMTAPEHVTYAQRRTGRNAAQLTRAWGCSAPPRWLSGPWWAAAFTSWTARLPVKPARPCSFWRRGS